MLLVDAFNTQKQLRIAVNPNYVKAVHEHEDLEQTVVFNDGSSCVVVGNLDEVVGKLNEGANE